MKAHELLTFRRLANKKASRVSKGRGVPSPAQGNDGDMRMNETDGGMKLYVKMNNQWFGFTPDAMSGTSKTSTESTKIEENGYETLSSGLIIQWGVLTHDATTKTLTFPLQFPNNVFTCVATAADTDVSSDVETVVMDGLTRTQVEITGHRDLGGATVGRVNWIAIGN